LKEQGDCREKALVTVFKQDFQDFQDSDCFPNHVNHVIMSETGHGVTGDPRQGARGCQVLDAAERFRMELVILSL